MQPVLRRVSSVAGCLKRSLCTDAQGTWARLDTYFEQQVMLRNSTELNGPDPAVLAGVLAASDNAGLPPHAVSPLQGKFLALIAAMSQAHRVLEIGTLGGYSTLWFASAVHDIARRTGRQGEGRVVSLEVNPQHAAVARQNLIEFPELAPLIEIQVGDAVSSLTTMIHDSSCKPFDLIFIDADKPNNSSYLAASLQLSRPGTVIVGDNVVRGGAVLDPDSQDSSVIGVREFLADLGASDSVSSTVLQTVGTKGYDGFTLSVVTRCPETN